MATIAPIAAETILDNITCIGNNQAYCSQNGGIQVKYPQQVLIYSHFGVISAPSDDINKMDGRQDILKIKTDYEKKIS